ncbi:MULTISPECIES: helix-turn-helix transcriptional regulator [Lysobacteraceae]|nr:MULTISPECIES: AlpA family transcriptional regulator [Lysobacter]
MSTNNVLHGEPSAAVPLKFLRLPEVQARTGCSRSTIYLKISDGTFPRPTRLGGGSCRSVAWVESEINEWLRSRIAERDAAAFDGQEG